jgi:hypothetical protein
MIFIGGCSNCPDIPLGTSVGQSVGLCQKKTDSKSSELPSSPQPTDNPVTTPSPTPIPVATQDPLPTPTITPNPTYSVGVAGTNVIISPNSVQTIASGAKGIYIVTPNTTYNLNTSVGGTCPQGSWNGNQYTTGVITSDCSISFSASLISYNVSPSFDSQLTVTPSIIQTVGSGGAQTFTVTAQTGYTAASIATGTCSVGSWNGSSYTTGIITAPCSVVFSSLINSYLVSVSADAYTMTTPNATQTVTHGNNTAFNVTSASGYSKSGTVGGTCPQGTWSGATYTTGAITVGCSVSFSSTINSYIASVSGDAHVTVSPNSNPIVNHGSTQTFSITAGTGYSVSSVVNGTCPSGSWSGSQYTTGVVTNTCSIGFSSVINSYSVAVSADAHTTVSPNTTQAVNHGSTQSFNVTAGIGYSLSSTVGGTCPSGSWSGSTYTTGVITSACSTSFSSAINLFTVSVAVDTHTSVSPNAPVSVAYDSTQTFNVTAATGYTISSSVGGTCPSGSWNGGQYTSGAITGACSVSFVSTINSYTIGGTISGLTGTVVLQNNVSDNLSVSASGAFTFLTPLNYGSNYSVTVLTHPSGQTCSVTAPSGLVSTANVISTNVTCSNSLPSVPQSLAATITSSAVHISWGIPSFVGIGTLSYTVKRSTTSGSGYTTLASGIIDLFYDDISPGINTTYYYVVIASNTAGPSTDSAEVSVNTSSPTKPDAPSNFLATPGNLQNTLTWGHPSTGRYCGPITYTIKRNTVQIATTTNLSYVDTGLNNGTTYNYQMRGDNWCGGSWLNSAGGSGTPYGVPTIPTSLTATTGANSGEIALNWNAASGTGPITYTLTRSITTGTGFSTIQTGGSSTSFIDSGLVPGNIYYYMVNASNGVGASAYSSETSTQAQLNWRILSTINAPSSRGGHTAIWTGDEMVVWGGSYKDVPNNLTYWYNDGYKYNPSNDSWSTISAIGAPAGRASHKAVYTGGASVNYPDKRMVVWGGNNTGSKFNTGGIYTIATDTWTSISTTNAPTARVLFNMVWDYINLKFYILGGVNSASTTLTDGGIFNMQANTWSAGISGCGSLARQQYTSIFTTSYGILSWGGFNGTAATNDGCGLSTVNVPTARFGHTAIWTGTKMIIWGGNNGSGSFLNTGASYDPTNDTWTSITTTNAPAGRMWHEAVWTGSKMVVWGGGSTGYLDNGGIYDPSIDKWTSIPSNPNIVGRRSPSMIWTDSEVIIFGGDTDASGHTSNNGAALTVP